MPLPGLGFELECRGIALRNKEDRATEASDSERERVRGKEIIVPAAFTEGLGTAKDWTLTAELVGAQGVNLLCPEIVIHGPDVKGRPGTGQGVKLTEENVGTMEKAIGRDIDVFLERWAAKSEPVAIRDFEDYGTWEVQQLSPDKIPYKSWGLQVTAPIPLAALYSMLPVTDPHDGGLLARPHSLISFEKYRTIVRVAEEDLDPRPESGPAADALLAFLSLVVSYIKAGPLDTNARGLKHVISIMPRTDFTTLYLGCAKALKKSLVDTVQQVCDRRDIRFKDAQLYWRQKSTIIPLNAVDWVKNLPDHDLVADYDRRYRHGQIGGLGSTMEQLIGKPGVSVPIFEFRDVGSVFTGKLTEFLATTEQQIREIHAKAAKS